VTKDESAVPTTTVSVQEASDTSQIISEAVSEVLEIEDLDFEKPFQDYGLDSIIAMRLSTKLEKKLSREIQPQLLIEFPTVIELTEHLENEDRSIMI
ncbi:MAG: acyl carrier protein, partial [Bacteroidota bacterium]